jgi:hypothetical protein
MVLVAIEQYFPEGERIITDDFAYPILPFGSRIWVRMLGRFTSDSCRGGIYPARFLVCKMDHTIDMLRFAY